MSDRNSFPKIGNTKRFIPLPQVPVKHLVLSAALILAPLSVQASDQEEMQSLRKAIGAQQELIRQQAEALENQQHLLDQQVQEMERLTERLEALEKPAPATASGTVEEPAVASQAEQQEDDSKATMEIYGFAQGDLIHDFGRMDPNWDDAFRPSRIPTAEGEYGSDGQSSVSVKQSRLGVAGSMPTGADKSPLDYKFEFDLFGVGADEGQTTFRLRHAYGEWGPVLAGQTHSLFMDINVFPNTIDYWGPSGMVFLRNPQLRWTPWRGNGAYFALGLENSNSDVDPGLLSQSDPALGANIQGSEPYPDLTARWRTTGDWGHFQAAGILRSIAYETLDTPGNQPEGSETGWGVNLSTNINFLERDRLIAQVVYGEGIASYMNDGGMDMAPQNQGGDISFQTVPLTGVVAYYDHYWNDRWSSAVGYSFTEVDTSNYPESSAFNKGE